MPVWRKLHLKTVDSLDLNDMPGDFTRLLWVLLPLHLDRCGRGIDNNAWVRSKVFPLREDVTAEMVRDAMQWYADRGMIERYRLGQRAFFWIPTWHKHQGKTDKEAPSDRPAPTNYTDPGLSPSEVAPSSGASLDKLATGSMLDESRVDESRVDESRVDVDGDLSSSSIPHLITLLSIFNRKRFTNNAQRQQAERLLHSHQAHFLDAARWAQSRHMELSEALNNMQKALPGWRSDWDNVAKKSKQPKLPKHKPSMQVYDPGPPDPLAATWAPILAELKGQMAKATFDAHLAGGVLLSTDDPVRIGLQSQIACDWVGLRLNRVMCDTLRRHLKRDVSVQYEVIA